LEKGGRLALEGFQVHQEAGGRESIAERQLAYGLSCYFQGQFGKALPLLQSSRDYFEGQAKKVSIARATIEVGNCLLHLGKYETAYIHGQRGLALFEDLGSYSNIDQGRLSQCWVSLGIGSLPEAEHLGRQAVTGSHIKGDIRREGISSAILGFTLRAVNKGLEAKIFLKRSLQIADKFGIYQPLVFALPVVALLLIDENQIERAVEVYFQAENQPIIGNSHWWRDSVGREIDQAGSSLSSNVLDEAKIRAKSLDLWETAKALVNDFL